MFELYLDDLLGFFEKGGLVLFLVFILALCLWALLIERYIYIAYEFKAFKKNVLDEVSKNTKRSSL